MNFLTQEDNQRDNKMNCAAIAKRGSYASAAQVSNVSIPVEKSRLQAEKDLLRLDSTKVKLTPSDDVVEGKIRKLLYTERIPWKQRRLKQHLGRPLKGV